ncbi:phosphate ABC transporter permease subunit PstC [Sulfurimonas aquatica]|uniref:Phosphate transport system permease protein n=1 Tax=Sulfurimonas aquatica TaxID=2672570 RepID=A0A975GDH3_9BACT|nr:phosphate ABC transporter permease subunit PstC [Sulfurimonas aquatica]QSZ42726.1 phosphate ABC transporter permease subunit PstC [Sulfurimonas aquatica]
MEKIFQKLSISSATLVFVILIGIFITLFIAAKPAIDEFGFDFIVNPDWNKEVVVEITDTQIAVEDLSDQGNEIIDEDDMEITDEDDIIEDEDEVMFDEDEEGTLTTTIYGGLVPIVGTLLTTLIALAFALPIAMGIAVFLAEIAPKNISHIVGIAIELLAAIPSIIFGMWGLYYFAPIVADLVGGYQVSLLTAGLVLGVMILPFMAAITRDSMNTTPGVLKESAYALGATKFEVIKDIIFPYSRTGIIGSIILALGRALGETMAVAFLIGSIFVLPSAINDPTISIPVAMANNFGEASGLGESALFYLALILFVISFAVISIAKFYFLKKAH